MLRAIQEVTRVSQKLKDKGRSQKNKTIQDQSTPEGPRPSPEQHQNIPEYSRIFPDKHQTPGTGKKILERARSEAWRIRWCVLEYSGNYLGSQGLS